MKKLLLLVCMLSLTLFSNCCHSASHNDYEYSDKFDRGEGESGELITKEFKVAPGGNLDLKLRTGGKIVIKGWDKEIVAVNITQKRNDVIFEFEQNGNDVTVESEYRSKSSNHSGSPKIVVNVPVKYNSKFNTLGGSVDVSNVEGKVEGTTMGGEMIIDKVNGRLDIKTMGGAISVKNSNVDGLAKTMGGEVLIENVVGDLDASSMGGKVRQINVTGKNKSIGKEIDIHTMGGDIDIDTAPNGAKLKTMGGDITVNSVGSFLDAETMGGDINVKKAEGKVKVKTMGGDIEVNMSGAPENVKDVSLTSLGGDITITLPEGASLAVDIDIELSRNCTGEPKIISDFNVDEKRTNEWEKCNGQDRKHIYGKGVINGGKYTLKIKNINGNVYLKKS